MEFVVGAFASWLFGKVANSSYSWLSEWVVGSKQERALRQAAVVAINRTAEALYPDNPQGSNQSAMVIDQVFAVEVPSLQGPQSATLLESIHSGIAHQIEVLDNADETGVGKSSAELLGIPPGAVVESLTDHLLREIINEGARGGPLVPLADQLNHELTQLGIRTIQSMLGRLIPQGENAQTDLQHRISSGLDLEFGRLLIPALPVFRETRDAEHKAPSYTADASILFYLIEEFIKYGAVDVAVDAYRYTNAIPVLPRVFRNRITEIDRKDSTSATLSILTPVLVEQGVEVQATEYGIQSLKSTGELSDEVRSALFVLLLDLEEFIRGMHHGLLVVLDLDRMRKAVRTLLKTSRSPESRANLVTIEQATSTYRPYNVGAVTTHSTASSRMVEIFEDLFENQLFRQFSRSVPTMGEVGNGELGVADVTQAAKRLADSEAALDFMRYRSLIPSERLHLNKADASEYLNSSFFPPIVSAKKALERAEATWRELQPEFIPTGHYPPSQRLTVSPKSTDNP